MQKTYPIHLIIGLISLSSFGLSACSHVAGNVIPSDGPTMESIYDDCGEPTFAEEKTPALSVVAPATSGARPEPLSSQVDSPAFLALDNPQLKLYLYPHFSGSDMLPIPGYWTAFPAYPRQYYALPLATETDSMGHQP